jgi:hypothetical protein
MTGITHRDARPSGDDVLRGCSSTSTSTASSRAPARRCCPNSRTTASVQERSMPTSRSAQPSFCCWPPTAPLARYIHALHNQQPELPLTIVLPELIVKQPWHQPLHHQTSRRLRRALRHQPGIITTTIPLHLPSDFARGSRLHSVSPSGTRGVRVCRLLPALGRVGRSQVATEMIKSAPVRRSWMRARSPDGRSCSLDTQIPLAPARFGVRRRGTDVGNRDRPTG